MKTVLILILLTTLMHGELMAQIDRQNERYVTRSEVIAANGMVATSQPLAAQVGLDILRQGGNAIDAAIAANAAMGLMEPTGNGIGGDLFALVWHEESGRVYALNASGRSPLGLSVRPAAGRAGADRGRQHPAVEPALGIGAGRSGRMVRTARPVRRAGDGPHPPAIH